MIELSKNIPINIDRTNVLSKEEAWPEAKTESEVELEPKNEAHEDREQSQKYRNPTGGT